MRVLSGPWSGWDPIRDGWVTVGVLDGVHVGHRFLLDRLKELSKVPTVLTFDPHPVEVLAPGTHPRLITTVEERLAILKSSGVAQVGVLDLAEIRHLGAEDFVSEVLVDKLGAKGIVAGPDFRFARDRTGDLALLKSLSGEMGYQVEEASLVEMEGVVSSSRIRDLIEKGQVRDAAGLMGRRYQLTGPVVHGDKRGREIGFPTANLGVPPRKVVPGNGVYAAFVTVDDVKHRAAVNVGVRPTFGDGARLIEAYILDFSEDIYEQRITIEFAAWIRPELKFDSVDALVARMGDDVERASRFLRRSS